MIFNLFQPKLWNNNRSWKWIDSHLPVEHVIHNFAMCGRDPGSVDVARFQEAWEPMRNESDLD